MFEVIPTTLFSILAVLALILFNALWVAAEFAIVRVRRTRLEELAGQGVEAAKHAIVVVDGISDYLALTQIGITVASLAVGWLAEDAVVRGISLFFPADNQPSGLFHAGGVAAAFLVVTVMHVILGEQVPKLLAVRAPSSICWFSLSPCALFMSFCARSCGFSSACRPGYCTAWDMGWPPIPHSQQGSSS
jgi:CBS domain containing-hemolysin-like protein